MVDTIDRFPASHRDEDTVILQIQLLWSLAETSAGALPAHEPRPVRPIAGCPAASAQQPSALHSRSLECSIKEKIPAVGVEPTLPCGNKILSLARLPISPRRLFLHFADAVRLATESEICNLRPCYTLCCRYAVERKASQSSNGGGHHGASFTSVFDSRKRKIRGLWQRGDRFYARCGWTWATVAPHLVE